MICIVPRPRLVHTPKRVAITLVGNIVFVSKKGLIGTPTEVSLRTYGHPLVVKVLAPHCMDNMLMRKKIATSDMKLTEGLKCLYTEACLQAPEYVN